MQIQEMLKAINGAAIAGLGAASAALAASPTHTISLEGWLTVAVTVLTAFGVIFSVSNADPIAKPVVVPVVPAPMSVTPPTQPATIQAPPAVV